MQKPYNPVHTTVQALGFFLDEFSDHQMKNMYSELGFCST
mgnify:FL=1